MLLTLGAAGATVLVMLALLGAPAIGTCGGDARGLVACLRGLIDDRFDLGAGAAVDAEARPVVTEPPPAPVVVDKPAPKLAPAPPMVVAEPALPETTRWLTPDAARVWDAKPTVVPAAETEPEPTVVPEAIAPPLAQADVPPEPAKPETPPETIALAKVAGPEPAPPVETSAPSFVPPAPTTQVEGVPPDLQVAAVEPPTEPVPDVAQPPSDTQFEGPPPDLAAVAEPEPEPAGTLPDFVPPPPTIEVEGLPPDLQVAAVDPEPTPTAEPAPDFVLPVTPALPATPPPDLTIAATEPVAPPVEAPAAAPVVAPPTIDAVEIQGDGNFIAGNGPAGANMRLYVDGVPAGVSPVEGGRWLVEGDNLLTEQRQTLKVEALDATTGKPLGEATIVFERPVSPVAATPVEPVAEAPVEPAVEAPTEGLTPEPPPVAEAAELPDLPAIRPVAPAVESESVTILPHPDSSSSITTLSSAEPDEGATPVLAMPKAPALVAQFTVPVPEPGLAPDVTVLRARPIGDPDAGRFISGKAIIRRGDTLWDIAHRYYGHGIHYRTIFRANRELIARPGKIYPGQVFDLPLVYDD